METDIACHSERCGAGGFCLCCGFADEGGSSCFCPGCKLDGWLYRWPHWRGCYDKYCAASAAGGNYYSCSTDLYHSDHGRDINVLGGVQAGYDWQYGRSFVFGVVGDWTWTNLKTNVFHMSGSISYESKVNWLASFRGRAGLALDDTLVYVTGGFGSRKIQRDYGHRQVGRPSSFGETLAGWVAGVGVEHKINRNWSVQFEYLRYDFGMNSRTYSDPSNSYTYHHNFTHVVDVGRIALNYRW